MPADLQYVIEIINEARVLAEMEPLSDLPKGSISDPYSCPIARALPGSQVNVGTHEAVWETFPGDSLPAHIADVWGEEYFQLDDRPNHISEYVVDLPREVQRWIIEFDQGPTWAAYRATATT